MNEITIILPGNCVSKKNSRETRNARTKTGKLIKFMGASKKYRAWETRARQAAEQQLQSMGITEPTAHEFKLEVKAFMKGNLMDLDAVHTAVMDCLEGIVWINDKQVKRFSEGSGVFRNTKYPRTEVTVSAVEDVERRLG